MGDQCDTVGRLYECYGLVDQCGVKLLVECDCTVIDTNDATSSACLLFFD